MMDPMKWFLFAGLALVTVSCVFKGVQSFEAHEVLLYGAQQERVMWVYGALADGQLETDLKVGTQVQTLRSQVRDPFGLGGTVSIGGRAVLRSGTSELSERFNVSGALFSDDLIVGTKAPLEGIYYTDGKSWYRLSKAVAGDLRGKVTPVKIEGLRGVGTLTDAEADLIGNELKKQAPLAIGVIPEKDILDKPQYIEPSPSKYLQTAFYLQKGVPTDLNVFVPDLLPVNSGKYSVIGSGQNARYTPSQSSVVLSRGFPSFSSVWKKAQDTSNVPNIDFSKNNVVTFFLGQRPTGGFGIQVNGTQVTDQVLTVKVNTLEPKQGSFTIQALTSPWVSLRVEGQYTKVIVKEGSNILATSSED